MFFDKIDITVTFIYKNREKPNVVILEFEVSYPFTIIFRCLRLQFKFLFFSKNGVGSDIINMLSAGEECP